VTAADYVADISSTLFLPASTASVVAKEYPLSSYSSPAVALGAVGTDAIFGCPALAAEGPISSTSSRTAEAARGRPGARRG
jgi:para-nitrobenzyl esterase